LLARNDLLKAELQSSNIELSLLDAESDLKLTAFNLDLLLGLSTNAIPAIDTTGIMTGELKAYEEYETLAKQNRKDIQALGLREKAANTSLKIAKADAYPTIALTGGYLAAWVPKFITITNAVNAGIGIKYDLASLWKTNARLKEAKGRQAELQASEAQLDDAISIEVNQAYQHYLLNNKKIEVLQKAVAQAGENYRITKNKYDNNLVTLTDLLDADVADQQAQLNETLARADAITAWYKLIEASGTLNTDKK